MTVKIKKEEQQHTHHTALSPYKEVTTLLTWHAPGRPFKKRTKNFFMSSILIVFLLSIVLLLFHQTMLMLLILSLLFVSFALNTVPPRDFNYKISTQGVTVEDHYFLWQELYDFYFKERFDDIEVLHIRTKAPLPGEITLTLGEVKKEQIKSVLLHYLPFREFVTPTFMEKSADWLTKNFPLEQPSQKTTKKVAS